MKGSAAQRSAGGADTVERERRQLSLGVLGHVDHGKTALVRALTGIETDRLVEERERGLSIVAGYAYLETPDVCIDLIDAPGHRDFIRAMIGAASGIDAAVLVVAVNEGIMPQTREHVAIAGLLGVRHGVVCLTKCDLAGSGEIDMLNAELLRFLDGTWLRNAPIIQVSAQSGEGIAELRDALLTLEPQSRTDVEAPFFMPVDRSFTMSGFGRILTGTVHATAVSRDDELVGIPGDVRVSVRGIQVHGRETCSAAPGQRAALNLRTGAGDPIRPGAIIGHDYAVRASRRLDVLLEPLEEFVAALGNGAQLRLLLGTAEAQVRLRLLERDAESEKDRILAQLRCDRDVAACPGMRFILRSNSPGATVAGGIVIDPAAPRRRRFDRAANADLASLAMLGKAEQLGKLVEAAGTAGLERDQVARRLCVPPASLDALVANSDVLVISAQVLYTCTALAAVEARIVDSLRRYHSAHPQHSGMRHAELAAAVGEGVHDVLVRLASNRLCERGEIAAAGDMWRLASFDATARLSRSQRQLAERMEKLFANAGVNAPSLSALVEQNSAARETLRFLIETGRVVALQTRDRGSQLALHADAIRDVQARIAGRYPYPSEFAVSDVRDLLGTTRRHAVPLLEHLDATGFTLRRGDLRQIRKSGGE